MSLGRYAELSTGSDAKSIATDESRRIAPRVRGGRAGHVSAPGPVGLDRGERSVRSPRLGGSGRPVVLLARLGATAHDFDEFAPQRAATCRVYAVTRRGFGRSSSPPFGYDADELGHDVLAVIDSLGLRRRSWQVIPWLDDSPVSRAMTTRLAGVALQQTCNLSVSRLPWRRGLFDSLARER